MMALPMERQVVAYENASRISAKLSWLRRVHRDHDQIDTTPHSYHSHSHNVSASQPSRRQKTFVDLWVDGATKCLDVSNAREAKLANRGRKVRDW